MRLRLLSTLFIFQLLSQPMLAGNDDSLMISNIFNYALVNGACYQNLEYMCYTIGPRLSGSNASEEAIRWTRELMESYDFDRVYLQEVMVPVWERGQVEVACLFTSDGSRKLQLNMTALGNNVGTGPGGIQGKVVEIKDLEELEILGREHIEGNIVFINKPMDPGQVNTSRAYSHTAGIRYRGPEQASRYGATGVVVRSLTTRLDDVPHTGSTSYSIEDPPAPSIAISTRDADRLSELLREDPGTQLFFETHSRMLEDKVSYNVIGEIKGTTYPDEYIVVGGHLDSWDVGHGAHDDGAGCMHAVEALRILKSLDYKPKRTIRVVLFTNEENGLRGGRSYAEFVAEKGEKHIAAIESDSGGFTPRGFSMDGTDEAYAIFLGWAPLFYHYRINEFIKGGGGADIGPLKKHGTTLIGFRPDSQRYFKYHHSAEDTFDKVDERELEMGAAAITSLVYLIDRYGLD